MYRKNRSGLYLPDSVPQVKGYGEAGASRTKRSLRGFNAQSGSPTEDIDYNNFTLRQRARMLYMASPLATSAINTNRTNVIGTGLRLQAAPDNSVLKLSPEALEEWKDRAESEFELWAENRDCDALGLNNFYELQQLALKSWLMSGDVFILIRRSPASRMSPYTLRLQVIEADRVCTPDVYGGYFTTGMTTGMTPDGNWIYDGVETDGDGRAVAYHICNTYPLETLPFRERTWTRVEAIGPRTGLPNILHVMDSERPDSYRGVPYLAQVIEPLLQVRRYTESELTAALVQSYHTAWITTGANQSMIPFNEAGAGDIEGYGDGTISDDENEYEMGAGTVFHLKEGEDIRFGNPTIPTAGFENFVKVIAKMVGSALEIPYELLLKEFDSSYSASRGALLEAWKAFRMRRTWFADDMCRPVYRIFLSEAVASGRIRAPGFFDDPLVQRAWCGSQWIGPTQDSLDPTKEVEAAILQVQNGFKTRSQVTREMNGGYWEENVEQLEHEERRMKEAGLKSDPVQGGDESDGNDGQGQEQRLYPGGGQ